MEHSLFAYLQRQSTQTLHRLMDAYEEQEVTELNAEILTLIQEVLRRREKQP